MSEAVARRYAQAYFDVAGEHGSLDEWREPLALAVGVFEHPSVASVMANPRVTLAERVDFANHLLDAATPAVRNLVRLLIERGRTALLAQIFEHYDQLVAVSRGTVKVTVTTAVPVDARLQSRIVDALRRRLGDVDASVVQDPEIIGGLIVRIGDRVVDNSVRTKLQQLQTALT